MAKARPAAHLVLKVLVPDGEERIPGNPEHGVIHDRPLRRITIPHRKRAALEWHLFCRMVYGVVHVHVPRFSRGIDLVVKLVCPGPDVLLQIVVAEVAVVETVSARVDRSPFG